MIKANGNGKYTSIVYLRKNQNQGEEYGDMLVALSIQQKETRNGIILKQRIMAARK